VLYSLTVYNYNRLLFDLYKPGLTFITVYKAL